MGLFSVPVLHKNERAKQKNTVVSLFSEPQYFLWDFFYSPLNYYPQRYDPYAAALLLCFIFTLFSCDNHTAMGFVKL